MMRPTSFAATDAQPLPQTSKTKVRPVSEVYVRPISDLLERPARPVRTPTAPVVRFREPEIIETPKTVSTEDDPSAYDSDASQTSSAVRRRRRRTSAPRKSTTYLLAKPAPKLGSKKHLLKHVRPRLLLQLQELPADQRRPRPTIDVFPASLIAGPLVTARYLHRFPRIFGVKCELGPRDLILVKSEDYDTNLSESEDDDEHASGRREPVAVLSPVRGLDCDEIVLDDGTVWTARPNRKGGFDFVHVDKHGLMLTARWVKRSLAKSSSSRPTSPSPSPASPTTNGSSPSDPNDYRYTFSIINPLSRRHPILATLTSKSFEIFDDYTTVSSSQGRYPPTCIANHSIDAASTSTTIKSPLPSPSFSSEKELPAVRQTHPVDAATKKLIMVSGLWLSLRLDGRAAAAAANDAADAAALGAAAAAAADGETSTTSSTSSPNHHARGEQYRCMLPSRTEAVGRMPRRQTTSNATSSAPSVPVPAAGQQTRGLRRAMSTGAAFMQRRMRQSQSHSQQGSEAGSSSNGSSSYYYNHGYNNTAAEAAVLEMDEMMASGSGVEDNKDTGGDVQQQQQQQHQQVIAGFTSTPAPASAQQDKQQKQSRRVSWLKKLKH